MYTNPDNSNFSENETDFLGGTFQKKPDKCLNCNELTFKTVEENYVICQGCMFKDKRKQRKRLRQTEEKENPDLVPEHDSPYYTANSEGTEELYDEVMGRFHKLTPMEKQVVELLAEEKTQEEVAEILSITRGEVSTYLDRARIKLK